MNLRVVSHSGDGRKVFRCGCAFSVVTAPPCFGVRSLPYRLFFVVDVWVSGSKIES
jgi:hypothetical protein